MFDNSPTHVFSPAARRNESVTGGEVLELCRDTDDDVREAAVLCAGRAELALDLLADCLDDPSPAVRDAAIRILCT